MPSGARPIGHEPALPREGWHNSEPLHQNDAAFALQSPDVTHQQVVETLVRVFYADLFRLAKAILGDLVLAGQITRATVRAAVQHRGEFQGEASPQAWLYALLWHQAKRRYPWHVRHTAPNLLPYLQHLPREEIAYVLQTKSDRLPQTSSPLPNLPPLEPLSAEQIRTMTQAILSGPQPARRVSFPPELRWVSLVLFAVFFLFLQSRVRPLTGEGQPLFPTATPTRQPTPTAIPGAPLLRFTAPLASFRLDLDLPQIISNKDGVMYSSALQMPWSAPTTLPDVSAWIASAAFAPHSGLLVAGDSNGRLHVLKADGEKQYTLTAHDMWITHLAFSPLAGHLDGKPNGQFILASGDTAGMVKLWQLSVSQGVWRLSLSPHPRPIRDLAFSSDGKYLAVAHETGVWLWGLQPTSAVLLHTWDIGKVDSLAFHPFTSLLALAHSDGNTWFLSIPEGEIIARLDWDDGHTSSLAWAPDGRLLATGDRKGQVNLWQVSLSPGPSLNLIWLKRFQHDRPVIALATSLDGEYLAAAVETRGIWVWNLEENVPAQVTFNDSRITARAVVFSPESAWLVAVGAQGGILLLSRPFVSP